jgi:hypothetical protein
MTLTIEETSGDLQLGPEAGVRGGNRAFPRSLMESTCSLCHQLRINIPETMRESSGINEGDPATLAPRPDAVHHQILEYLQDPLILCLRFVVPVFLEAPFGL